MKARRPAPWIAALAAILGAAPALAADWSRYNNARFSYGVDLPPGFPPVAEAENSDGGTSELAARSAVFSAWGANLLDETFGADIRSRIAGDRQDGWAPGHQAVAGTWASWSGTRAGRIRYTRAILLCREQQAFVSLEYDAAAKAAYDPIVTRVARSLKGRGRCR